jgi:hypothetical protein
MKTKALWQCPACGEKFVTKNMWHSCGKFSLEDLFARSEPHVFEFYQDFAALVKSCGPVTIIPQKTRLVFQARVRFISCTPRKNYLLCSFGLSRKLASPRFHKITRYAPRWFGHEYRLTAKEELDDELIVWIRESYDVGQQKHLSA